MTKAELRREYRAKRNSLSYQEYARCNQQIFALFREHFPITQPTTVHCYLASKKKREANTALLIEHLLAQPDVNIVTSRSHVDGTLTHHRFSHSTKLEANQWGILEPLASEPAAAIEDIDWVIVPLLAFDRLGYRVGYGKGYYDRFLAQCRPDTQKIGLSLDLPIDHITDTDSYDIPLDYAIAPSQLFSFRTR